MDSIQRLCTVENCGNRYKAHGYCSKHYAQIRAHGKIDTSRERQLHGKADSFEYRIWKGIRSRINNPNNHKYPKYGGRGIKICKGWDTSFLAFYRIMGDRPSPMHSVDRINNAGNYSCGECTQCIENDWPMNCRWTTKSIQARNQAIRADNTTGYKGVAKHWFKWTARIVTTENNVTTNFYIGLYDTAEEAAIAYDQACIFFRGSEAKTNIL